MTAGAKKGVKGKGKSGIANSKQGEWDWARSRERVLTALSALLTVDLAAILAAPHERQRMVSMAAEAVSFNEDVLDLQSIMTLCTCVVCCFCLAIMQAMSALESDAAMKQQETRMAAFNLLLCICSRHGQHEQLEQVTDGLLAVARR